MSLHSSQIIFLQIPKEFAEENWAELGFKCQEVSRYAKLGGGRARKQIECIAFPTRVATNQGNDFTFELKPENKYLKSRA